MAFKKHVSKSPPPVPPPESPKETDRRERSYVKSLACSICQEGEGILTEIVDTVAQDGPLIDLAARLHLDPKVLDQHVKVCVPNRYKSRYARVALAFDRLWEALDTAHRAYQEAPHHRNAIAYQALLAQFRGIMVDLDTVQDADDLVNDITDLAVNPLIRNLTNAIISESGSLKEGLRVQFNEVDASRIVNDFVKRIASHFRGSAEKAHATLTEILTARDKTKAKTVKVSDSKPAGKHANLKAVS